MEMIHPSEFRTRGVFSEHSHLEWMFSGSGGISGRSAIKFKLLPFCAECMCLIDTVLIQMYLAHESP